MASVRKIFQTCDRNEKIENGKKKRFFEYEKREIKSNGRKIILKRIKNKMFHYK